MRTIIADRPSTVDVFRAAVVGCAWWFAMPALAAVPRVALDISPTVECRDVTSEEFAREHPDERIVEATFQLSVFVESSREAMLEQLRLGIESPERRLRVVDYQPRTELASELACDIEVSTTVEKSQSLSASLGGTVGGDYGPANAQVSPAAGIGVAKNQGSKESYRRLTPKQLVLASGTTNAEHGVFFKWKRSSQVALEGAREATVQFRVDRDWRGDWVEVRSEVWAMRRNYLGEKIEPCGATRRLVGLYLAGDGEARQAARALADEQLPALAAHVATNGRHISYKPSVTTDHRDATQWLDVSAWFKACHEKEETDARGDRLSKVRLNDALERLRHLAEPSSGG